MPTTRLEAFSDAVIAILMTIMVLELRAPEGPGLGDLHPVVPVLLIYVLSFANLGIYWNNHHHLFFATDRISGGVLWANLHLLFWLSLFPFTMSWMAKNHVAPVPTALYGVVLLCAAIAYFILTRAILATHGPDSRIARALGRDFKGKVSVVVYAVAVPLAFASTWVALSLYVLVALMWLVPDRRIEAGLREDAGEPDAQSPGLSSRASWRDWATRRPWRSHSLPSSSKNPSRDSDEENSPR